MASKKERQKKKKIAQNERRLLENKNIQTPDESSEESDLKSWVQPPRQEEVEFEHDGQNYRTFYRIFIMHKNHKGEIHHYKLEKSQFVFWIGVFLVLLVSACGILAFKEYRRSNQLERALAMITTLEGQLYSERQHSNNLSLQISELSETVDILSDTLTTRTEALSAYQEEERRQYMPTSYPLRGTASYYVPEDTDEDGETEIDESVPETEEKPNIKFMTGTGSSMVATANGEVTGVSITDDGSYTIVIDHGNGYMTIYTGPGTILVKEGEVVTTGTILLGITEENTVLTYQIILNGEYIDPMECMEING